MNNVFKAIGLGLTILVSVFILANAYKYKFKQNETITVTGLAEKDFESDQIIWTGSYSRKTLELKEAYSLLKQDEKNLKNYFTTKGINANEIIFSAVSIEKEYESRYYPERNVTANVFTGYKLTQNVTIDSKDMEKVEKTSREVTELIEQGIEFNSSSPSYYFSKLSELKIDLLAKASADAKLRAETIAKNSGSGLGDIKNASMGIFQITGKNSNEEFSYGGVFNTTSRVKTASITIKIDYAVD
ncbi:MAG: SIMPL domain-containing protein [Sphingomonadales bacterium]|nr:SIMPL domain-containing protein [Sphingomonadales bacterium]